MTTAARCHSSCRQELAGIRVKYGQDGQPGEDFGHPHTELCFPHKATISGEMTLDVTSIMHNNPGDFFKVIIQIWAEGLPDLSGECGEGSAVACKVFDPPHPVRWQVARPAAVRLSARLHASGKIR